MKYDDNMKVNIKEPLRKISYPKTMVLKPPSELVKTKGPLKKVKPTENDNSAKWSPSYFEHVDSYFPNSPTSKSQKNCFQGCSH